MVASARPWNRDLARRLEARIGRPFVHISQPADLNAARLRDIDPAFVFIPHWSHRISAEVFDHFTCVIFHMTDVPYGRGGSPLQNLITRGHSETMISAIKCGAELDAGPVYLRRPLALHGSAEEIFLRADGIIEEMIVEILDRNPAPVEQQGTATVFQRRRPEDGALNGTMTLDQVHDYIRMLDADGYPPAFLDVGHLRFEFTRVGRRPGRLEANVTIRRRPETS